MRHAAPISFAEQFRATTRGQIVDLLRCEPLTTEELASALRLGQKAVRAHLLVLERDGLIRQQARRRRGTVGKPAGVYEFDPAAEHLFSAAYAPALIAALTVAGRRAGSAGRRRVLQTIGQELAASVPKPQSRDLRTRVESGAAVLKSWGGIAMVEETNGLLVIRGCGCPVSSAVRAHPETCVIVQAMLARVIGAPVRERCDRSAHPSCRFEVQRRAGGPKTKRGRGAAAHS